MHFKSAIFATVLGLGMVGAVPAIAQQEGAGASDLGEQLYMTYCATCHGEAGDGEGPLGGLLTVNVPDITQLTENNHGAGFPMLQVIHVIDGRSGMRAHEGPMPFFGELFFSEDYGPYGSEAVIRGQTLSLALYLESIQQ